MRTSTGEEPVYGSEKDNTDNTFHCQDAEDQNSATHAAYHDSIRHAILVYDQVWHYSADCTTTIEDC